MMDRECGKLRNREKEEYTLIHPEDDDYMTYQEAVDEYGGEPSFLW